MKTIPPSRTTIFRAFAVVTICPVLVGSGDSSLEQYSLGGPPPQHGKSGSEEAGAAPERNTPALLQPTRPLVKGGLTPSEVIGNPACLFQAGHGNAAGTGLVVLPAGRSARFEVLDGEGRVFGDALPFRPNHYRLAKHHDGSVIAGFADLRLNSLVRREEDTPEPIRIFRDGRVIYAADKVWNFGLAPDGSAFFVIEPGADHTSQLVIHNLAEGSEHQYDLGYKYTSSFDELPYGVQFSITGEQVMMVPSENGGGESFLFFPADGSASRTIPLEGPRYAIFESMKYGYVVVWQGKDQPNLIQKKQLRWNASKNEPESVDVWSRPIDLEHFYGTMSLSNDGAWLILNAWVIHVLDTSTGETVFTFPIAKPYEEQQLARLSTVLKPGATVRDLGGGGILLYSGPPALDVSPRFPAWGNTRH